MDAVNKKNWSLNINNQPIKNVIIHLIIADFCPGIGMLTFALLMSARMGIFQEILYKQYGKHSKEALFYNVSLGLFFFKDLLRHAGHTQNGPPA